MGNIPQKPAQDKKTSAAGKTQDTIAKEEKLQYYKKEIKAFSDKHQWLKKWYTLN